MTDPRLEAASPFDREGRLKTEIRRRLDAVSPFRRDGRPKNAVRDRLDEVSEVDTETGLPKPRGRK